jgi:hypothetical protein
LISYNNSTLYALQNDLFALCVEFGYCYHVAGDSPIFQEAMDSNFKELFQQAISKEYLSLQKNQVLSQPCDLPKSFVAIDTILVLKLKETGSRDSAPKAKARLCGKGYLQRSGIDYHSDSIYAPVALHITLRIFLLICVSLDYEIDSVDVITAYLLAPLKEEIYLKIPSGYPTKLGEESKVLRLLKSLYGLKQAPHDRNKEIDTHLKSLGFIPTGSDRCLYHGKFLNEFCYFYYM